MEFIVAGLLVALGAISVFVWALRIELRTLRRAVEQMRAPVPQEPVEETPTRSYLSPVDRSIKRFERRPR